MSLLDILCPPKLPDTRRGVVIAPMGDFDAEIAEAAQEARDERNRQNRIRRRCRAGGAPRIDGQTRMQIVYAVIAAKPGVMPREIGREVGLDPSPVYVAIRWLRNCGYIETRDWCKNYVTDKPAPIDRRGLWAKEAA